MTDLQAVIKQAALQDDLPWQLVQAICTVESSLNPWAFRYEPTYRWLIGIPDQLSATERMGQQTSWGICQIMGAVAREYGFTGWFPQLCDPQVGLRYGLKYLGRLCERYTNWQDAIASYNAGSPRRTDAGLYVNQGYVDRVLREWHQLDPPIALKESEA